MSEDVKTTSAKDDKPTRSTNPKPPRARAGQGVPKPPKAKAAKKPAAKRGAPAKAPIPAPEPETKSAAPELKKQELLAKVVERADVKKKFAKPVVEAMLAVLGEALAEGREMNLQPLGKIKNNRIKETSQAKVIVAKIRQKTAPADAPANAKQSIADADEER
ncbi:DNA-binding protein [Roseovarius spongiae]|uniref:DNA-binding protein n=1 Tax=Roseovarius spongiae TaxID=2320272 RepID=A0A3A8AUG0_9RHOB|nr:HU family DNA-binding protein [Roseovarius spongiae]RKF15299.1 DNA-binding protein [Roseovarius spongiae]